jgi:hypothetical protein
VNIPESMLLQVRDILKTKRLHSLLRFHIYGLTLEMHYMALYSGFVYMLVIQLYGLLLEFIITWPLQNPCCSIKTRTTHHINPPGYCTSFIKFPHLVLWIVPLNVGRVCNNNNANCNHRQPLWFFQMPYSVMVSWVFSSQAWVLCECCLDAATCKACWSGGLTNS